MSSEDERLRNPTSDELIEPPFESDSLAFESIAVAGQEELGPIHLLIELPVGIDASGWRAESDSLGSVQVPADRYWGAQTQRSLKHFRIGSERMPIEVYRAYGHVKMAAALANIEAGVLPEWKGEAILRVCEEILSGALDDHFPLNVFQSGSGTHTNANVNEVIANRGNQLLSAQLGRNAPLHPNDDVNMSQSSNDTFVTAMHIAAYDCTSRRTIPALRSLQEAISAKATEWAEVMKVGRTHLMDATTLTVGQEWSGYAAALRDAVDGIVHASIGLLEVALGGTAVGTGLNAPPGFTSRAIQSLVESTGFAFRPALNPFAAQATLDPMIRAHASLKSTAVTLFKIANDLRWLASGPRNGLQELRIPANEPGSTIMPGKVNPSQLEAMLMVCIQVIGLDTAVTLAGAEGNFELNVFRPIVINNYLDSARLLADASHNATEFMVIETALNVRQITANLDRSIMVITALSPVIGYERSAAIVRHALDHDLPVRESALLFGVDAETYDAKVKPTSHTNG